MKKTAVSQLKATLSEHLARVKAGEEVIVTERGKPIARLVPVERGAALPEEILTLARAGLVRVGSSRLPRDFWRAPRPQDRRGAGVRALLDEREGGR